MNKEPIIITKKDMLKRLSDFILGIENLDLSDGEIMEEYALKFMQSINPNDFPEGISDIMVISFNRVYPELFEWLRYPSKQIRPSHFRPHIVGKYPEYFDL